MTEARQKACCDEETSKARCDSPRTSRVEGVQGPPTSWVLGGSGLLATPRSAEPRKCLQKFGATYHPHGHDSCQMQRKKQNKRKALEKPKLENARQLRGIFFVEPNDEEFKLAMKAARRKLEVPMLTELFCKIPKKSSGESRCNIGKR